MRPKLQSWSYNREKQIINYLDIIHYKLKKNTEGFSLARSVHLANGSLVKQWTEQEGTKIIAKLRVLRA